VSRPPQKTEASHIGGILSRLLGGIRPPGGPGMLDVWQVWPRAAGEDIGRNARPAAFKGSILLVTVSSSVWLHHLQFHKKALLHRINAELGKPLVTDIKFKVGSF
jgi:hypothetical protein